MSFVLNVTIHSVDTTTQSPASSFTQTLQITGRPDPAGGTVCQSQDKGQPQSFNGGYTNGINYTETIVFKCSGSYHGGKLSYTETITKDEYALSDGGSCIASGAVISEKLTGTFSSGKTISGTFSADGSTISCTDGSTLTADPQTGTWTGTL